MSLTKNKKLQTALTHIAWVLLILVISLQSAVAQSTLPQRSLQISDPNAGQTNVNYILSFDIGGAGYNLGSVDLKFCSNSPLIGQPCTPIPGFDISAANIINQTGVTDFSIAPGATANTLVLTRTSAFVAPTTVSVEFDNVTNPSARGSYYGRVQTYTTEDATGVAVNEGGVVFVIEDPLGLSTEVPPYLFLCVGVSVPGYLCTGTVSNFIDMGEFSKNSPNFATSQFIVATNAGSGFVVYINGNPPTSGNNVIPGLNNPTVSIPGQSQFGLNLRDNSNPDVGSEPAGAGSGVIRPDYNIVNRYKYTNGDMLVTSNTTSLDRKFTVSYLINISNNQKPGIYSSTFIYVALATF